MLPSITAVNCTDNAQRRGEALRVNISAGEGLQDVGCQQSTAKNTSLYRMQQVLASNLGPSGTLKMLVDGAGGVCGP